MLWKKYMVAYVAVTRYGESIMGRVFVRHEGLVKEETISQWENILTDVLNFKSLTVLSFQEVWDDGIGFVDTEKAG